MNSNASAMPRVETEEDSERPNRRTVSQKPDRGGQDDQWKPLNEETDVGGEYNFPGRMCDRFGDQKLWKQRAGRRQESYESNQNRA